MRRFAGPHPPCEIRPVSALPAFCLLHVEQLLPRLNPYRPRRRDESRYCGPVPYQPIFPDAEFFRTPTRHAAAEHGRSAPAPHTTPMFSKACTSLHQPAPARYALAAPPTPFASRPPARPPVHLAAYPRNAERSNPRNPRRVQKFPHTTNLPRGSTHPSSPRSCSTAR